jgi:hypothetical protein
VGGASAARPVGRPLPRRPRQITRRCTAAGCWWEGLQPRDQWAGSFHADRGRSPAGVRLRTAGGRGFSRETSGQAPPAPTAADHPPVYGCALLVGGASAARRAGRPLPRRPRQITRRCTAADCWWEGFSRETSGQAPPTPTAADHPPVYGCGLLVGGASAARRGGRPYTARRAAVFAGCRCAQPTRPAPSCGLEMGGGDLILAGDGQTFLCRFTLLRC